MEIAVGSTSPAVLQAEIVWLYRFLVACISTSGYKASWSSLTVNANEQRALENMDIAVGISFLGVVELEMRRMY